MRKAILDENAIAQYNRMYENLLKKDPKRFSPSCPPASAPKLVYNLGQNSALPGAYVIYRSAMSTNMEDEWMQVSTLNEAIWRIENAEKDYFYECAAFDSHGHLIATKYCVPSAPKADGSFSFSSGDSYDTSFHIWRRI